MRAAKQEIKAKWASVELKACFSIKILIADPIIHSKIVKETF